ncbi:DUF6382 domain-containing protein [Butyrivibrio sp. JL13D10]|uniref:DUF6382 domain-containing protein n=1 Tax=Butyrivibrio sp. JL13D10 TaxID=3236815 RepID=UPI0038B49DD1
MDIQYFKDAKHNYIIMQTKQDEENIFQYKMLENNQINGLLPFTLRNMDECYYLYFEIDKKQSIKNRYCRKKMTYEAIVHFFEDYIRASKSLGDYLLDPCHIVLSPEAIFEELSTGNFSFIYDPGYEALENQSFLENLMEYADMEDEKGSKLIYKLLDSLYDGSELDISFVENVLEEEKNEGEKERFVIEEVTLNKNEYLKKFEEDSEEEDYEDKKVNEKKIGIKSPIGVNLLMAILFALVSGALVYLRYAYVLTYEENLLDIAVFMVSTMMSLTCFVMQVRKNNKAFIRSKSKELDEDDQSKELSFEEPIEVNSLYRGKKEKLEKAAVKKTERTDYSEDEEETVLLTMDFGNRGHKLYAMDGSNQSNIDLGILPIVIGKLSSCSDIVVNDRSVSRMHAKIYKPEADGNTVWIQDLNSTNGTYINGKRLMPNEEVPLEENDEISFGKCVYAFR